MANIYVRSTDGSDSDNGSTWALAKATLDGALDIAANGDTVYVSHVHAESTAAPLLLILAGSVASPLKILCVNDGAEPPTTLATTATVQTTGNNNITMIGGLGVSYIYGITFTSCVGGSAGAGTGDITVSSVITENCDFILASSGDCTLNMGIGLRKNMRVKFGAATQKMESDGILWKGGSILSGGTSLTILWGALASTTTLVEGVDFSNFSSTFSICSGANAGYVVMRNCKLPASWSGSLISGTVAGLLRHALHNCDAGDTNYRLWVEDLLGSAKHELVVVKTSGASDGTTPISWKIVTSSRADEFPFMVFKTPEIVRWNEAIGSPITVTVDIIHDSLTNLQDDEVWLEVQYLGTSGVPLSSFIYDSMTDMFATPADQSASTATWTTTGLTNPNKQKLNVTFTPQEKGFIHATVHVVKASYTLYIDPVLVVS